jgi:transposase InsO family protein
MQTQDLAIKRRCSSPPARAFGAAMDEIGARLKLTRPFRPQTNGKAERLNGTLLNEWA